MKPVTIRGQLRAGFLVCDFPHFKEFDRPVNITISPVEFSLTPDIILKTVSEWLNIPSGSIVSKSRKGEYVFARYLVIYLSKIRTKAYLKEIGLTLGGRDHSTVLHGYKEVIGYLKVEGKPQAKTKPYKNAIEQLESILNSFIHTPPEPLKMSSPGDIVREELIKLANGVI